MKLIKKDYFLFKNTEIYIKQNRIFIICNNKVYNFKIPYNTFINIIKNNKALICFLFTNYNIFKGFITNIISIHKDVFNFYFFKLKLKGLGFRIRKVTDSLIKFFFTSTNFFYLHLPDNLIVKLKKRKIFFISSNLCSLKNIMVELLLLKKLIVYKTRGLVYPRQIFITKPGKKRF